MQNISTTEYMEYTEKTNPGHVFGLSVYSVHSVDYGFKFLA